MVRDLRSFALGVIFLVLACVSTPAQSVPTIPTGKPADNPTQPTAPAGKPADNPAQPTIPTGKPAGSSADNSSPNAPPANNPLVNNSQLYSASMAALTMLFVIAVLLENALAVIFNWRVFLTYFSLRGVKTIVMVGVSLLIVWQFRIDVMANLIAVYQSSSSAPVKPTSNPFTLFITALILAGGSAGINRIMVALGFRGDRQEEIAPKPPANKAWISVRISRKEATSQVLVRVREIGPADANSPSPIAGEVAFKRPPLAGLLFPDVNRFPANGGYTLLPNVVYSISVESKDNEGNNLIALNAQNYVFAPSAIVDFFVTL
jgi:hypothetical protein